MHEKEVLQGGGSQILPVLLGWGPVFLDSSGPLLEKPHY